MKILLCLAFIANCAIIQAQSANPFMNDANGRPLFLRSNYLANGSPYLYDEYCLADVTLTNGKVYPDVKVKINLQEKQVLFYADNGVELIVTTPVKKIRFYNIVLNGSAFPERTFQGHLSPMNAADGNIYEVLSEDSSATLLKQTTVSYTDSKGYSDASITRSFKKSENYFVAFPLQGNGLHKVEKNKTAVAALFGDKNKAISSFIEQRKLKCKSEQDLIEICKYYHSL